MVPAFSPGQVGEALAMSAGSGIGKRGSDSGRLTWGC